MGRAGARRHQVRAPSDAVAQRPAAPVAKQRRVRAADGDERVRGVRQVAPRPLGSRPEEGAELAVEVVGVPPRPPLHIGPRGGGSVADRRLDLAHARPVRAVPARAHRLQRVAMRRDERRVVAEAPVTEDWPRAARRTVVDERVAVAQRLKELLRKVGGPLALHLDLRLEDYAVARRVVERHRREGHVLVRGLEPPAQLAVKPPREHRADRLLAVRRLRQAPVRVAQRAVLKHGLEDLQPLLAVAPQHQRAARGPRGRHADKAPWIAALAAHLAVPTRLVDQERDVTVPEHMR